MEAFLNVFILLSSVACVALNFFLVKETIENLKKIDLLLEEINRSLVALKEPSDPTKPMKSNNWDSMKKVFTVQSRGDSSD